MATIFDLEVRDTASRNSEEVVMLRNINQLFYFENGTNKTVKFRVEASPTTDFNGPVELLEEVSVSMSSNKFRTLTNSWTKIRIVVTANTAPTSGRVRVYDSHHGVDRF